MPTTTRWLSKALLLSVFLVFLFSKSSFCGNRAQAYYHFLKGLRLYRAGNLYEAKREFLKTISEDPLALLPRKYLVEIYWRLKEYDKAESMAIKALEVAPEDDDLRYLLAKLYFSRKRPEKAIVILEEVVKRNPYNKRALGLLINAYIEDGNFEGAIASLEKLIKLHPDSYTLWLLKARLLSKAGRSEEAGRAYEKAVELSSYKLEVVLEAGEFFKKIKAYEKAKDLFEAFLERHPENFHVIQELVNLLVETGDWKEAEERLRALLEKNPDNPKVLFYLGYVLEKLKRQDEAVEVYERVLDDGFLGVEAAKRVYAILLEERGEVEALSFVEDFLRTHRHDPRAYEFAIRAFLERDRCKEALRICEEASEAFPQDKDLIVSKGLVLSCLGKLRAALKLVKPLLEKYPDDPVILNFVGYTYAELGINLEEAERLVRKALEVYPDAGYIVDSLAWVLYKKGDLKGAYEHIKKAVRLSPEDGVILEHYADILWELGKRSEACKTYEEAATKVIHSRDRERISEKVRKRCKGSQQ